MHDITNFVLKLSVFFKIIMGENEHTKPSDIKRLPSPMGICKRIWGCVAGLYIIIIIFKKVTTEFLADSSLQTLHTYFGGFTFKKY